MTNAGDADEAKWPSSADWERFRTALRDRAFEEAAIEVHAVLYPNNPESDWTKWARERVLACGIAEGAIRALKSTGVPS